MIRRPLFYQDAPYYPEIVQDGQAVIIGPSWIAERMLLGWADRDYKAVLLALCCGPLDWVSAASIAAREAKNEGML